MYVQIGSCPKCGAPIYSPAMWNSIFPSPSIRTCNCNRQFAQYEIVTTTDTVGRDGIVKTCYVNQDY